MNEVFIIGSKGIPAKYGGFETFVDKLTENRKSKNINYHVSCLSDENRDFIYNNARCFNVKVPNIGAAKAVYYDLKALYMSLNYIEKNKLKDVVIYILACRIGPFMWLFKNKINKLNIKVYVNPDGHEWKRGKWSAPIKWYWKQSEKYMVKNADLLICDSINIEKYIHNEYAKFNPKTMYISYGADTVLSTLSDESPLLKEWYDKYGLSKKNYYLIVGRFVPENNYELMIREFMKSSTTKDLVIITNVEQNKFYNQLEEGTDFKQDSRIKFVGTLYNQELLKKVRENAFGYLHGHEVGGTNPSLLEALATTNLNLLLNVGFNKEVALDGANYFDKDSGSLSNLINELDKIDNCELIKLGNRAKERINSTYTWDLIVNQYEELFQKKL